jgi:DNA-directed RNA polymerase subunit RPC12/RpoP
LAHAVCSQNFNALLSRQVFHLPHLYRAHVLKKHSIREGHFTEDYKRVDLESAWKDVTDLLDSLRDVEGYHGTEKDADKDYYCKVFVITTILLFSFVCTCHLFQVCKMSFGCRGGMVKHWINHHQGDESYKCRTCTKEFPTKFLLFAHRKSCSGVERTIGCDQCEEKFATTRGLTTHISMVRSKILKSWPNLLIHLVRR